MQSNGRQYNPRILVSVTAVLAVLATLAAGRDAHAVVVRFSHQQTRHAARRVAAGFDLAAVGVENAHRGIRAFRFCDHDYLIAAHSPPPVGDGVNSGGVQRKSLLSCVEHDEIVAQAVHFEKRYHDGPI